jgi:hypothetical protein
MASLGVFPSLAGAFSFVLSLFCVPRRCVSPVEEDSTQRVVD